MEIETHQDGFLTHNDFQNLLRKSSKTLPHNTMTKVLFGCQLYSKCLVDEHCVRRIVNRVKSECLTVMKIEDNWEQKAREANYLDVFPRFFKETNMEAPTLDTPLYAVPKRDF